VGLASICLSFKHVKLNRVQIHAIVLTRLRIVHYLRNKITLYDYTLLIGLTILCYVNLSIYNINVINLSVLQAYIYILASLE
jgi:hypothetical protein